VKAGQPLFTLDDTELRARLGPAQAAIDLRVAELVRAETRLARTRRLRASDSVPAAELEDQEQATAVARAAVAAARADLAQTEALLARLIVRAPRDAVVLQVNTRPGEYLAPGAATPPLVLGVLSELQVRAEVDEQLAPRVRAGARATGFIKGDNTRAIELRFARIEPYVVPKRSLTGASVERVDTRVLQVIFSFARTEDRAIYVGQQLDVFIEEP
jgi:HlyD family secretion protein